MNKIDHFTIGADTLEQGMADMQTRLGINIPRGSKHDAMSTHNCVTKVGESCFLEVISIDPDARDPGRVRWFSLDDPKTRANLARAPRPLGWVVNTDNLDEIVKNSPVDLGEVVFFQRGERTWRLTVPSDGSLVEDGLIPAFIEWSPGPHPSSGMQDLGLELIAIQLQHPEPERIQDILTALGVDHLATVTKGDEPALGFELGAPDNGVVMLRSNDQPETAGSEVGAWK